MFNNYASNDIKKAYEKGLKLIAHFQRFWHQVSSASHNLQDTQPIALGYSFLIKVYSLYKQGKNLAVMGTFSLVMRGLKECMSEMQSKYWLPPLIRALLRPFWCHNLNFDRSKFRLLPAVCPSEKPNWLVTVLVSFCCCDVDVVMGPRETSTASDEWNVSVVSFCGHFCVLDSR